MDETRESRVAAILARGLIRVRHVAERMGLEQPPHDDPSTTAAETSASEQALASDLAASTQGEQQ